VGRGEGRVEYVTAPALRDNKAETKANMARLMGIKQNQKQSYGLHHPQSGILHVAAISLTGDEGSSNPISFLGRERLRETLQGQKEVLFVSIIIFTLCPDALSLNCMIS
jgi:hypothetical protein